MNDMHKAKQTEDKEALFTQMPVGKAVLSLAVPTVISQLITVVYNMADTFFVGQLNDPAQVAAATVSMPLFMLMTALTNLFGIGGASLISRSLGAKEPERAARCSAFCVWSAAGAALVYGAAVLCLRPWLLPVLGANEDTWHHVSNYLFWTVGLGALPTILSGVLAHLVRAEGYARQASLGVALGGILNMALDPLLLFVFRMEITGAAIATFLSNVAALGYFLRLLYKIRGRSVLTLSPGYFTLGARIPGEVLSVGLPSFLISLMATVSNTCLNRYVSAYSNEAMAGMGIAKKMGMLAFALAQGLNQGTLPLIGYTYTSGRRQRMLAAMKTLLLFCVSISFGETLLLFFGAESITGCFIQNQETVAYGRLFLRILSLACMATTLNFYAITLFQATGQKLPPILLSLMRKGTVDVLLMYLLNQRWGVQGIAWATPGAEGIALLVSALLVVPYIRRLCRQPEGMHK